MTSTEDNIEQTRGAALGAEGGEEWEEGEET